MTPTARTLAKLRKDGITAQVVERFNPYGGARVNGKPVGNRVDLFSCIDIIAIDRGILAIQATTGAHLSHRRVKCEAEPRLREWLANGGRFELWGWRKLKRTGRWQVRRIVAHVSGEWLGWVEHETT